MESAVQISEAPEPNDIRQILELITQKTGVDLLHYKYPTLHRRILRRMHLLGISDPQLYFNRLRNNEQEQLLLFKSMLIHVSSFFRDEPIFAYLCTQVLPALLTHKQPDDTIRVWVCGCSTGEEAYSIAICLHEHAELIGNLSRIKIFASDISETAIVRARLGVYPGTVVEKLSAARQQRYFSPHPGGYRIRPFIRELCVFAVHDATADPPFPQIDLISCRNVLIYMQPVLQRKILASFSYALKTGGYLFLGKSETNGLAGKFEVVNKQANIFINRTKHAPFLEAPRNYTHQRRSSALNASIINMEKKDFQFAADELLLARYTPVGVVVNDAFDIVDFRGNTGFYIEPSPGIASFNVLKMVRKGLYFDLHEALNKTRSERVATRRENIALEHDGRLLRITLEVEPLAGTKEKYYLVLFRQEAPPAAPPPDGINDTRDLRILQLEQELLQSREQLRALSEEQEATNEEFQSTNEELKTLNEELQTSQEEIVSINEELMVRNKDLTESNGEARLARQLADSITNTVSDALLVLSADLRVQTANTSFYDTFQVRPEASKGRFVYDLGNGQWNIPALRKLLEDVLPRKSVFRDFIVEHEFESIGRRTMKLSGRQVRGESDGEALILLAIDDITELTAVNAQLLETQRQIGINEERQRLAIAATHYGIWDYDLPTNRLFLSEEARVLLGSEHTAQPDWQSLLAHVVPDDRARIDATIQAAIRGEQDGFFADEYRLLLPDTQQVRWISNNGKAIFDTSGAVERFTGIVADITDRKNDQARLQQTIVQLEMALKAGQIGTWELLADTRQFNPSDQFKALIGLPPQASLTYQDLVNVILEEDRPIKQQVLDNAIAHPGPYRVEFRVIWPDDSIHWLETSGTVQCDEQGRAVRLVGVTSDITERKNSSQRLAYSEHHFKTLANSAPVIMGMSDADFGFYFFNRQWQQYIGVPEEALLGNQWQQYMHPDDLEKLKTTQSKAQRLHRRFGIDLRMKSQDKYRWISCTAEPRFDADNAFAGYTMACADMHDQRMLTDELERVVEERTGALRDLNDDLKDRNNELKQFAYVTSHDLQEPLRKIKIFAGMLLAEMSSEPGYKTEYLQKIESSAIRMMGLIRDLLNYSSIQERTYTFNPVDLNQTIRSVLVDYDLLIQEKTASITADALPTIDAVPLQMNQLFYNLIGNALKFSKPDIPPRIQITAATPDAAMLTEQGLNPAQPHVEISVTDNGIGFNQEYSSRIFEIFQRLHTRESYSGNGIGLALCKRIVSNHQGTLVPHSQENTGTTFSIFLPLKQP